MVNNISILLATYNASHYLKIQLDSLSTQTYKNFKIFVRDDLSTDNTLEILNSYNLEIISSTQNVGIQRNFNILLDYALQRSDDKYFMFCDQDDAWQADKIEKTLIKMKELESRFGEIPLLVHTDLVVVNDELQTVDKSFFHYEQINPTLNELNRLLMQNTITGCTVMINKKLAELAMPIPVKAIMHDRWLGLAASCFGKIGTVTEATILYRQHGYNSVGTKGFKLKYFISNLLRKNIVSRNIVQAKAFLEIYRKSLDDETIEMLEEFSNLESKSFWKKRKILLKYKLLKQGFLRNLGLVLKI